MSTSPVPTESSTESAVQKRSRSPNQNAPPLKLKRTNLEGISNDSKNPTSPKILDISDINDSSDSSGSNIPIPIKYNLPPLESANGYVIFITGLPPTLDLEDLEDELHQFGAYNKLVFPRSQKHGNRNVGYCIVTLKSFSNAEKAIKILNQKKPFGSKTAVDWAFFEQSVN